MKRAIIIVFLILFLLPSTVLAEEIESTGWTGHGLYLIQGDLILNQVNIDITINSDKTAFIDGEYETENITDKTTNAYFGVPEQEVTLNNFKSWVSPYAYNSKRVDGDSVNKQIQDLKTSYSNWRTWPSPYKPGEKRTVRFTYDVENKLLSDSQYLISFQLDHIRLWPGNPKVNIKVNFDSDEVKIYNFGNQFSIMPELGDKFTLNWSFNKVEKNQSIDFDYYPVDYEILEYFDAISSGEVKKIINSYKSKNYDEVIQLGKSYIKDPEDDQIQKSIYFLMAEAYLRENQPDESLIIYKLLEGEIVFTEGLQEKLDQLINYNKAMCYLKTEDFTTLYRLLNKIQTDDSYSFIYHDWAKNQINKIPEEVILEVDEEDRVPEGLEKLKVDFLNGEYTTIVLIGGGTLIICSTIISYLVKKKKDSKFLFRK